MDTERDVLSLLNHVADGTVQPQDALLRLKLAPFEDLGYAKVDHHRGLRQGVPEVIYGQSKTPEQISGTRLQKYPCHPHHAGNRGFDCERRGDYL